MEKLFCNYVTALDNVANYPEQPRADKLEISNSMYHDITEQNILLVFTYHGIKPKNRNHLINKVTNKGYDRYNIENNTWALGDTEFILECSH